MFLSCPLQQTTLLWFGQHMKDVTAFQSHLLSLYIPYLGDPLLEARAQSQFSFLVTKVFMKTKDQINQASVFQYCGPF